VEDYFNPVVVAITLRVMVLPHAERADYFKVAITLRVMVLPHAERADYFKGGEDGALAEGAN